MKINRKYIFCALFLLLCTCYISYIRNKNNYSISTPIHNYNLNNKNEKNSYLNYVKKQIYPIKLRAFIDNMYINHEHYNEKATGLTIKNQMSFLGYKTLFSSLFDKTRTNFDDCPVTDNFKNKFNTNLLDYYNLKRSDDAEVNCSLDMKNKKFDLEVYGIIGRSLNLEPNYYDTHHFTYTLDADGNVDDILLNSNAY